jgi:H+/Cl- antiporter ClcA
VGVWAVIPLSGFVLGFALPRWWIAAAAVPFGLYIVATNELEGNIGLWVAFVLSVLLAFAILSGVALRRLYHRRLHR